jgi:hypothetical protein
MVAAAIVGSAVVGGVASTVSSSHASSKAAKAATNAANENNATELQIYNQNKGTLSPFVQSGVGANEAIDELLGIGSSSATNDNGAYNNAFQNYLNSTGYQFQLGQGMKALNSGWAAKGLLNSGAAEKAAMQYGRNIASSAFGNYLGALQTQQATGLSAGNALAGVGTSYANATGANNNSAASAVGNAALSSANSTNNAIANGVNAIGMYYGLNSSYGGGGTSGAPSSGWGTPGIY